MQYALVNSIRMQAFPGGKGVCPTCDRDLIAKCGNRIMHHWAHDHRQNCDPWWENETRWHREWKNQFPEECREISHRDPNGEIHRADLKTSTGIVIELQHSAISDSERLSREEFYRNLVWVVDGTSFQKNFDILHMLPDPKSKLAEDIVWFKGKRGMQGSSKGMFWRPSENPNKLNHDDLVLVHSMHEIKEDVEQSYCGHHQYDWIRPRNTWLDATCPVYIDFGDFYLAKLDIYKQSKLPCVQLISKSKFIHDVSVELNAKDIATRFYPIHHKE